MSFAGRLTGHRLEIVVREKSIVWQPGVRPDQLVLPGDLLYLRHLQHLIVINAQKSTAARAYNVENEHPAGGAASAEGDGDVVLGAVAEEVAVGEEVRGEDRALGAPLVHDAAVGVDEVRLLRRQRQWRRGAEGVAGTAAQLSSWQWRQGGAAQLTSPAQKSVQPDIIFSSLRSTTPTVRSSIGTPPLNILLDPSARSQWSPAAERAADLI